MKIMLWVRVRKEITALFGRGDFGPGAAPSRAVPSRHFLLARSHFWLAPEHGAKSEHTRLYVSDEQRSHGAKAPGQIDAVIPLRTLTHNMIFTA